MNYAYDLNGSLITSTQGASTLSYNDRGRLASTSVNGKQVSYVYDEGGERTAKVAGPVTDTYVNQYYEEGLNGLVKDKRKFIYAGPIKVATINPDKSIAFHHEDHLSGASLTTNQKGNVIETVDYFPYGQVRIEEKSEGYKNDYLFTGQERDEETGLMYYGARYYDARVGRFMAADSWSGELNQPQTLNKYSYAANNPLKYVDPTGRELQISGDSSKDFINTTINNLSAISPYIQTTTLPNGNIQIKMDNAAVWYDYFTDGIYFESGTTLLTQIIENENLLCIQEQTNIADGNETESSANLEDLSNGTGGDSFVNFLPGSNPQISTYDDESGTVSRKSRPDYIGLGHELIHGLHFLQGTYSGNGKVEYSGVDGNTYIDPKEEVRTVGLGYNRKNDITENDLRDEHDLDKRNDY